ncbi:MAG: DEAD/DEAH box helicase [Nanoarchaeota archaeon]|nr:DEAD/DEAH box helicase [Nanoarchaeota archaeon]
MELINFVPRDYQVSIAETCKVKNTLVVLPTGTGKTPIALMVAAARLRLFPDAKIVVTAPTKPLCNQHVISFRDRSSLKEEIVLLTGSLAPKKRQELWESAKIVIATPQTLESDLEHGRFDLKNVSLLVLDECHRSRENYANTFLVKKYVEQSSFARILALTASPGSTKERVEEICKNLAIEAVEIRTEDDDDLKEHMQQKEVSWERLVLDQQLSKMGASLRDVRLSLLSKLYDVGLHKPVQYVNKKDLLLLQFALRKQVTRGNPSAFFGISVVAQVMKLDHLLTLVETQSFVAAFDFWSGLLIEETKAAKSLVKNPVVMGVMDQVKKFVDDKVLHPKMVRLLAVVQRELAVPDSRLIVFANYRDTVREITALLRAQGIAAVRFVGQADKGADKGLKQKDQAKILAQFHSREFTVLTASSVGEEGLDLPEVNAVIFYEPVASELRRVQRAGRTARTVAGKVIFLMAEKTMDEAYYWTSLKKETKMKSLLKGFQKKPYVQSRLV